MSGSPNQEGVAKFRRAAQLYEDAVNRVAQLERDLASANRELEIKKRQMQESEHAIADSGGK